MINTLLASAAAIAFILFAGGVAVSPNALGPRGWWLPAAASGGFAMLSIIAVTTEGPVGFWYDHTRNFWGNQIWFDLLLATAVAWAFARPHLLALGIRPLPWLALIIGTGSIGLLALTARVMYLRHQLTGSVQATRAR